MKGGSLISEGGYGCIFLPYITCKGKPTNNFNYISKIEEKNFSSENEINIGKIIKKIPRFYYYFVPAIYHCDINVSEFKNTEINKCRLLKNSKEKTPFILYRESKKKSWDICPQEATPFFCKKTIGNEQAK